MCSKLVFPVESKAPGSFMGQKNSSTSSIHILQTSEDLDRCSSKRDCKHVLKAPILPNQRLKTATEAQKGQLYRLELQI